jgi:hypothetical protein
MASSSVFRLILISLLHNVVRRVRSSVARFRCAFCSTVGPAYASAHTSSRLNYKNFPYILGFSRLLFGMFGCNYFCWSLLITLLSLSVWFCFVFAFILHYVCLTPMRSSKDTAITILEDLTYTLEITATSASLQDAYVDFYVHLDFASLYRPETCSK